MTFDEEMRVYEAKTKRLETRRRFIRDLLSGLAKLIIAITGLVTVLKM